MEGVQNICLLVKFRATQASLVSFQLIISIFDDINWDFLKSSDRLEAISIADDGGAYRHHIQLRVIRVRVGP